MIIYHHPASDDVACEWFHHSSFAVVRGERPSSPFTVKISTLFKVSAVERSAERAKMMCEKNSDKRLNKYQRNATRRTHARDATSKHTRLNKYLVGKKETQTTNATRATLEARGAVSGRKACKKCTEVKTSVIACLLPSPGFVICLRLACFFADKLLKRDTSSSSTTTNF